MMNLQKLIALADQAIAENDFTIPSMRWARPTGRSSCRGEL